MAKESSTASKIATTFTPRDLEILAGGIVCAKSEIAVDYRKLADGFGFKNDASARVSWNSVKKKIEKLAASLEKAGEESDGEKSAAEYGEAAAPALEPKGKAKANKSAKRKAPVKAEADEEDNDAEAPKSPVKKTRKAPAKKAEATSGEDEEHEGEAEEAKAPKKAPARKGRATKAKKGKAAATSDDEGAAEE